MPRATGRRGTPAAVLTAMAPHSVILVREGVVTAAQSVFVDFSAVGRETVLGGGNAGAGVGHGGESNGVALYCPTGTTVEIGDVFRYGDLQYRVVFVSPQGWTAVDGSTMLMAWADVLQGRGV